MTIALGSMLATAGPGAAQQSTAARARTLTIQRLASYLQEGVRTRRVPADLAPPLATASQAMSSVATDGCLLGESAVAGPPCVFGDTASRTTVVLFGDSHAGAWFTGIDQVSKQQHWRLIFLGKSGCPTANVLVIRFGAPFTACVTWREDIESRIAELHPALVIDASSEYLGSASPVSGAAKDHRSSWLDGTAATLRFLRSAAQRVVYIADVPRLKKPGAQCVATHRSDVRACTVARRNAFKWPKVRQSELRMAAHDGITGIDPASWFCTPRRCPVIVHHILVFRDGQHITPSWSRFLAPVLAAKLVPVMRSSPTG